MTQGDTLIRLMKEHQADVWRYLRFLGAEPSTADDVTQDTFIYMYRRLIDGDSRDSTGAYLRKAAKHFYLNRLRASKREVALDFDAADTIWEALTPGTGDDRIDALERCLDKLAERARRAIDLKYRDGRKETEVAEAMDTSAEAAKALLKRTREQLRECVERQVKQ
ncbi:MAG: sigma-70 family RNA polymerase sigma factor [Planctomycetes bacterium]|nr:sigma-70 family RNA polymerase sigma factor [Planctomycetota bacterium]